MLDTHRQLRHVLAEAEPSPDLGIYSASLDLSAPRVRFFGKDKSMPIILWLLGVPLVLVIALYLLHVI